MRITALIAIACLLAALPLPVHGQTVEGRVLDARSEAPVAGAYVALVTPDGDSLVAVVADRRGSFAIDDVPPGSYFLQASSLGYRSVSDGIYDLGEDGSLEVEIRLLPDPVMMDSLRVTVSRTERYLRGVGFYERREQGSGHHLTHEEMRDRSTITVLEAIRDIPRVHVANEGPAEVIWDTPFPAVVMRHGVQMCPPHIFLDGSLVHRGGLSSPAGPAMPDEFAHPDEIAAIEVYRGATEVPARFMLPNLCGAILIWTWH